MINGKCVVLQVPQAADLSWPTKFATVPRVGDFVSGFDGGFPSMRLFVIEVTHTIDAAGEPVIELTLGNQWF